MNRIRLTIPMNHLEAKLTLVDEEGNELGVIPAESMWFRIFGGESPRLTIIVPGLLWTAELEIAAKDAVIEPCGGHG